MQYRPEIDSLRAISVLVVILFHAEVAIFSGGFVGVDIFFVISGYLIASIILNDLNNNSFNLISFYKRRARRILPALYVVTLVVLILSIFFFLPAFLISSAKSSLSVPLFLSNFYFWSERGYFGTPYEFKPLLHTWSLAVEEQFYIFFPILLIMLFKFRKTILIGSIVFIFFVSLIASYYVTKVHSDTAFFFPFTRAWEILIGVFCAFILNSHRLNTNRGNIYHSSLYADILSLLGIIMIMFSVLLYNSTMIYPHIYALLPTTGCMIFILFSNESKIIKYIFSIKPFIWIGLISYSLYLFHFPIFAFAKYLNIFDANKIIFILLSFFISLISYVFLEKPFRNIEIISDKIIIRFSIIGAFVIILFSSLILYSKGLINFYPDDEKKILTQIIDYDEYIQEKFNKYENKKFENNSKKRVLLIGDSQAKDFLNIVIESGKFNNYQFSTKLINSECGNLYFNDFDQYMKYINEERRLLCDMRGRYEGKEFREIIYNSDEIWLSSEWRHWVIENLQESINNLSTEFNKPIKVIGKKNFGTLNIREILKKTTIPRSLFHQEVSLSRSNLEDRLVNEMKNNYKFYPIMDSICGGDRKKCYIFTPKGLLMSPDGEHLTKDGAIEAARRLDKVLNDLQNE
tara:strand:- start:885 stop:2777 length:1893 start_codon:yes stop_codon:yes gene_type:complete